MRKYRKTHKPIYYPKIQKRYREKNREEIKKRISDWRVKHPDWKEKGRLRLIEKREKSRLEIIQLLGSKCSNPNCLVPNGCTDIRCLQIDHINGGGSKERRRIGPHSYYKKLFSEIKSGSKDYQLLCANCNWIKRYEKGEV